MRISQDVSATSAQPWQAAPWSQRPSMLSPGACWAQIGSFEHSALIRSACGEVVFDVPRLLHEAAERPSASGLPV